MTTVVDSLWPRLTCCLARRRQVNWMVFAAPLRVPAAQVLAFQAYVGQAEHTLALNARPLQPLNGRAVSRVTLSSHV